MPYKCKQCGRMYMAAVNNCLNSLCFGEIVYVDSVAAREARQAARRETQTAKPDRLPMEQDPLRSQYLVKRTTDGTHWMVLAFNYARREALIFDYKNPDAEPIVESFDVLVTVDRKDDPSAGPTIITGS